MIDWVCFLKVFIVPYRFFTLRHILTRLPNPSDWVAGLSIAGLLLPEAVAYSRIGNLPMQSGIIALFAGLLCYGMLGKSRFAIVSATSSSAALLAASVLPLTGDDEALRMLFAYGLVMVTGMMFIVAAMAKVGSITDFIAIHSFPTRRSSDLKSVV